MPLQPISSNSESLRDVAAATESQGVAYSIMRLSDCHNFPGSSCTI